MKGKVTAERILRRANILSAAGMANEINEARTVYSKKGWFGLISWRTRDLEKMSSWMLPVLIKKYNIGT
jgi:hypothetical protein